MECCKDCGDSLELGDNWRESSKKIQHYVCSPCVTKRTTQNRRNKKLEAIQYLGGKCLDCDGVFHSSVYDFHHLNPKEKESKPSALFGNKFETLRKELDKCVLLCSNCHRIRHSGSLV